MAMIMQVLRLENLVDMVFGIPLRFAMCKRRF
jgi:hypothetical protein